MSQGHKGRKHAFLVLCIKTTKGQICKGSITIDTLPIGSLYLGNVNYVE